MYVFRKISLFLRENFSLPLCLSFFLFVLLSVLVCQNSIQLGHTHTFPLRINDLVWPTLRPLGWVKWTLPVKSG